MRHERELVFYKSDDGSEYQCTFEGCNWTLSTKEVQKRRVSPNALQDHAHTHRALSVVVANSSTPIEVTIVQN